MDRNGFIGNDSLVAFEDCVKFGQAEVKEKEHFCKQN